MIKYFPIVLFCYNRPEHLHKVLTAFEDSYDIDKYKIYLYCDGPKNNFDNIKIDRIRNIIEKNNNLKFGLCGPP